jgi:hypothetical protein
MKFIAKLPIIHLSILFRHLPKWLEHSRSRSKAIPVPAKTKVVGEVDRAREWAVNGNHRERASGSGLAPLGESDG